MVAVLIDQKALHQKCLLKSHCEVKDIQKDTLVLGAVGLCSCIQQSEIGPTFKHLIQETDEKIKTSDALVLTKNLFQMTVQNVSCRVNAGIINNSHSIFSQYQNQELFSFDCRENVPFY